MIAARLRSLNWFDEAIAALFAIGDGALIWLAIAALLRAHNPERHVVSPVAIAVGVLLANLLPRFAARSGARWQAGYALTAAGFLLTIAIWIKSGAFPDVAWTNLSWLGDLVDGFAIKGAGVGEVVWLSVFGAAAAWRRGTGQRLTDPQAANEHLRQGTVALIAVLALNSALRGGVSNSVASLAAIVFFAASLTAIALARSTSMLGGVDVGRAKSPTVIAGPAATAVGIGLLAGALVSRQVFDTTIWLLSYPVGWIWFVGRYLLIGLAFVFFILFYPIFWLLNKLPATPIVHPVNQPVEQATPVSVASQTGTSVAPDWIRYGVAALVFLAVCLVVIRLTSKRAQARQIAEDEYRERLPGDQNGSLLGDLWNRLRRRRAAADPLADLRGDPEWAYTVAIREAFGQFLEWTRARGIARRPAATAPEHVALFEASTVVDQDAEQLLAGYQATRYRRTPATEAEAGATVAAWRRLQEAHPPEES